MAESGSDIRHKFHKSERLRLRTLVEGLFEKGHTIYEYPLRLTYRALTEEELSESFRHGVPEGIGPVQLMLTVPKKKRRHAVDRVLMRRRMREAYRLHKHTLYANVAEMPAIRTLSIAIIYMHSENMPYSELEARMTRLLRKLAKKL